MDGRVFIVMGTRNRTGDCFIKICGDSQSVSLTTENLFREPHKEIRSPIDIFVNRNKALLTKLGELDRDQYLDDSNDEDRYIYNLFLLGFISNVESYFRSIIREIIIIDPSSYIACLEKQLTYAAAVHHETDLLPEALLEQCAFVSKSNVVESINKFTGISLHSQDNRTTEVTTCLDLFEQLCQLRHCIVHRAGLLGSKNAIKLGIGQHKNYFEKPIKLNLNFLQDSSIICLNSVRTTNNFLFNKLINRYIQTQSEISWDFRSDSKWFKKYFNLFNSTALRSENENSDHNTMSCFEAYKKYRDSYTD